MNILSRRLIALAALFLLGLSACAGASGPRPAPAIHDARLEYLKVVNGFGPAIDPELVMLLMTQFMSTRDLTGGIAYYEDLLRRNEQSATPVQRSLYLSALGLLRAQNAHNLSLLHRIGWVRETIRTLNEAVSLSQGRVFVT